MEDGIPVNIRNCYIIKIKGMWHAFKTLEIPSRNTQNVSLSTYTSIFSNIETEIFR